MNSDKVEAPSPSAWFLTREVGEGEVASSHASFKVVSSASWIRGLASESKGKRRDGVGVGPNTPATRPQSSQRRYWML